MRAFTYVLAWGLIGIGVMGILEVFLALVFK